MIKDLKLKTSGLAKGTFIISNVEFKPFKGKPGNFLSCEFQDKTGALKGIMWDGVDPYKSWLKDGVVVDATGSMASYNDAPQFVISALVKSQIYDAGLLIPSLEPQQIGEIITRLDLHRLKISNEVCKKVWLAVIGAPPKKNELPDSMRPQFSNCPGGKGDVHHAYCGGLAQHSESMVTIAEDLATRFGMDKDILMTGCLIHDMGKIQAYNWHPIIEMTDAGRLLHHTILGYKMLLGIAILQKIPADDVTLLKLAHIVISHHDAEGIRKPMFAEAVAVALIDNLDATTMHARDFSAKPENKDPDSNWTKYCQLTGRQYFIPVEKPPVVDTPPQQQNSIDDILSGL